MAWKLLVGTGLYRVGVGLLGGSAGLIKERKGNWNYCTYNLSVHASGFWVRGT